MADIRVYWKSVHMGNSSSDIGHPHAIASGSLGMTPERDVGGGFVPIVRRFSRFVLECQNHRLRVDLIELFEDRPGLWGMTTASQRLFSSYKEGFPCITEVGRNPLIP